MYLRKLKLSNHRGDTIVEVMVVLAVLGMAIGISYATANASLLETRQAQENSEATELAQSQIEALRTLTQPGATPNIFASAGPYCLVAAPPSYSLDTGSSCAISGGSFNYTISVMYLSPVTNPTTPDQFTVNVTWPDVQGYGNDQVTLVYRVHLTPTS
jgi:prepilin-type N-terminal cleavage/methylation domain-containing protein